MSDPYRTEDDARRAREAAARAERLAREAAAPMARDLRARAEAADNEERLQSARDDVASRRAFRNSVVGARGQALGMFFKWIMAPATPLFIVLGVVFGVVHVVPAFAAVGIVAVGVLGLLGLPVSLWYFQRLVDRELSWLADLPFPARGYQDTLSADPSRNQVVIVEVRLADNVTMPDDAYCNEMFGGVVDSVHVDEEGLHIESPPLRCPEPPDNSAGSRDSTHNLRLWLRPLLGGMLVPFHEAFPIREVLIRLG